jgi:hypothetical protein
VQHLFAVCLKSCNATKIASAAALSDWEMVDYKDYEN